jgi:hypothetical protein
MAASSFLSRRQMVSHCGGEPALRTGFPPQVTGERVSRHKASGEPEGQNGKNAYSIYFLRISVLCLIMPTYLSIILNPISSYPFFNSHSKLNVFM